MAKRPAIRNSAPAKPASTSANPTAAVASLSRSSWQLPQFVVLAVILACTCVIYWPATQGQMLWDDEGHITRQELRNLDGLGRIWWPIARLNPAYAESHDASARKWLPGATQQYYPLLHSAFWIQYQLWDGDMRGYHLVNLVLHLAATCLVYFILLKLQIPGALLAAAVFALHPVHVETVAWITEQKNTLSAVFYLGALLAYLKFDERRTPLWYALALVLFVLGLFSKTVTATLPAALLVIFWWQRGTLSWKRDVIPLLPFFALGTAFGLLTAWVESEFIGAQGKEFELSWVERGLLAGRVIWFYLYKLLWPAELIFIYPRWNVNLGEAWQWIFPLAAIGALVLFWAVRNKSRAPLAAWLFFAGTLFPVLGFFNVFPFMFSFVADHFQYLASLGVIVFVAGVTTRSLARLPELQRRISYAACVVVVGVLALLTSWQIPMYAKAVTLYRTTIERNPNCWMAYNNLGGELFRSGTEHLAEATENFDKCLELNPNYPEALNNLGAAYYRAGRAQEAVAYCTQALTVRPHYANAHCNLGSALLKLGQNEAAIEHLRIAVELEPRNADAHSSLGAALFEMGQPKEALEHVELALQLDPAAAEVHNNLGVMLTTVGRSQDAIEQLNEALRLRPNYPEAECNLGDVLAKIGQPQQAIEAYRRSLTLNPNYAQAHSHLGATLYAAGQPSEAIEHFERAVQFDPSSPEALNNLGAMLSKLGRYQEAIKNLQECIRLKPNSPDAYFNLGNTLSKMGRVQEAAESYAHATHLKPDFAEAWANLASANVKLQRPAEAAEAGKKALGLARAQGLTGLTQQLETPFGSPNATPPPPAEDPSVAPPAPALPPPTP